MNYRWKVSEASHDQIEQLISREVNVPRSIGRILSSRGVSSPEEARSFFQPSMKDLHDPFLMHDMDKAVDRLMQARENDEVVWVFGDYDVDGTTSTAMLVTFLREVGIRSDYYVSDRFTEGYGVSVDGLDEALSEGATLMICVDMGTTSVEAIHEAHQRGIETIVCDHHEPAEELPDVVALLNPIKGNCDYPFKHLCAGGVTFKLIQAFYEREGKPFLAYDYLDYAAIASSADMVPLIGENRTLVHFGLQRINSSPRAGIRGLCEVTNIRAKNIDSTTIVYNLAPRLNAAGRLGDASKAVDLLMVSDELQSFRLAQVLEALNHQRRVIDDRTFNSALKQARKLLSEHPYRTLVLYDPDWHVGVINIVASRIVERFHLPTVMLTNLDNVAKGSARSIKNFDIHSALRDSQELLLQFGGHKYASGLSLKEENIPELRKRLDSLAAELVTDDMLVPELQIDTELNLNELSPNFIRCIQKFAPFGYHNSKPTFVSRDVSVHRRAKIVGKNHLKFRAKHGNFMIDAIGFNLGAKQSLCNSGKPLSLVYTIEESTHRNAKTLQLYIKDVRLTEEDEFGGQDQATNETVEQPLQATEK